MTTHRYICGLLLLAACTGCASHLSVEVDVLDQELLRAKNSIEVLRTAKQISADSTTRPTTRTTELANGIKRFDAALNRYAATDRMMTNDLTQLSRENVLAQARISLQTAQEAAESDDKSPAFVETVKAATRIYKGGSLMEGSISNLNFDDNAAKIVHADKVFWRPKGGQRYDHASGFTSLGNSDIAIVQEDALKYTVKGMRVDGSKIPKVTLSLTRQLLSVFAAMNGIPTSFLSGRDATEKQTTGDAYDFQKELLELTKKQAANEQKVLRSRQAMRQLLAAIGEIKEGDLESTAQLQAAVAKIKAAKAASVPAIEMK